MTQQHQVEAVLDTPAASRLIARLSGLAVGTAVALDFCRTRQFEGAAFAALATFLAKHPVLELTVVGLGYPQRRVLQYLGACPVDPPSSASDSV